MTEIELLCWKTSNWQDREVLFNFISDVLVIELDQSIELQTAEIRKANKVKLPDAIIAATAIVNGLTLVTRNISDFKKFPNYCYPTKTLRVFGHLEKNTIARF
ncbi:type II toxin-antitoxin system VapC family toxin [Lunatimonas salinarum]|uniref:type II toxin-antitoxin system VapC family toxin n=1 Tax=Lunatimonas salinarum TaxID=1774590 RepID=UPI001ADEDE96